MAHKKETDKGSRHRLTPLDEGGWHRAREAYPGQASPQLPQINTRDMDAVTPCIGVSRREYALAGSSIGECRCGIKEASGSCKILGSVAKLGFGGKIRKSDLGKSMACEFQLSCFR